MRFTMQFIHNKSFRAPLKNSLAFLVLPLIFSADLSSEDVSTEPLQSLIMPKPDAVKTTAKLAYTISSNTIIPIDLETGLPGTPITFSYTPRAFVTSPGGQNGYVTSNGLNQIEIINLASGESSGVISLPEAPTTLLISPCEQFAYIAYEGSRLLYKINIETGEQTGLINLRAAPARCILNSAGTTLYSIYEGSNEVSVIDTATGEHTQFYLFKPAPTNIALSSDESTLYVTRQQSDKLLSVDVATGKLKRSPIKAQESVLTIRDIHIHEDGKKAYLTYENSAEIAVVDLEDAEVVPTTSHSNESTDNNPTPTTLKNLLDALCNELSESGTGGLLSEIFTMVSDELEALFKTSKPSDDAGLMVSIQLEPVVADEPVVATPAEEIPQVISTDEVPVVVVKSEPDEDLIEICTLPAPVAVEVETVDNLPVDTEVEVVEPITPTDTPTEEVPVTPCAIQEEPVTREAPAVVSVASAAPSLARLLPNFGQSSGGTAVLITGKNFTNVTGVTFGTMDATNFTLKSPNSIVATAPEGTGIVPVTVTTTSGTSKTTTATNFTYSPLPTVTKVALSRGKAHSGQTITIHGTNFTEVLAVKVGSVAVKSFKVVSRTKIKAVVPRSSSTVDVQVTTMAGTSIVSRASQYKHKPIQKKVKAAKKSPKKTTKKKKR